jgi:hypothetical protein
LEEPLSFSQIYLTSDHIKQLVRLYLIDLLTWFWGAFGFLRVWSERTLERFCFGDSIFVYCFFSLCSSLLLQLLQLSKFRVIRKEGQLQEFWFLFVFEKVRKKKKKKKKKRKKSVLFCGRK